MITQTRVLVCIAGGLLITTSVLLLNSLKSLEKRSETRLNESILRGITNQLMLAYGVMKNQRSLTRSRGGEDSPIEWLRELREIQVLELFRFSGGTNSMWMLVNSRGESWISKSNSVVLLIPFRPNTPEGYQMDRVFGVRNDGAIVALDDVPNQEFMSVEELDDN